MVKFVRRVGLFLSSPGDLMSQRRLITAVCEDISKDFGVSEGFYIDPLKWETHAYSAIGKSPQDLINAQIGDDYDIFLGMFGTRFGTPTDRSGSGTEEEFQRAVDRFRRTGAPEIIFLFLDGKVNLSGVDPDQFSKVQAFRKALTEQGVLYASFEDELSLHRLAYSHILQTVRNVLSKSDTTSSGSVPSDHNTSFDPLNEWNQLLAQDTEIHASVLMQQAAVSMDEVNSKMIRLTKANGSLLQTLKTETPKLAKGGLARPDLALNAFKRVVESVKDTNNAYLGILPDLHRKLVSTLRLCQRSLSIFQSRGEFTKEIADVLKSPLVKFVVTVEGTKSALDTMQQGLAVDHFPGTALSVEQRKLRALARDLSRILDSGIREGKALVSMIEETQQTS